jgi:putative endonuclease
VSKDWKVYILRCADDTLYTGVAKNLERRIAQHNEGKGAKYTRGRGPVTLLWSVSGLTRGEALQEEFRIKQLSRVRKLEHIKTPE